MSLNKSTSIHKLLYVVLVVSLCINFIFLSSIIFRKKVKKEDIRNRNEILLKNVKKQSNRIPGKWRKIRSDLKKDISNTKKIEEKKFKTLGYLSGYKVAPKRKGITIYDKDKAYNGFNLYCSGHAPEAILIDMKGNELHKWSYKASNIVAELRPEKKSRFRAFWWRRVHLFKNGDILALITEIGLIKLDINSNLIWKYRGRAHHDMFCAKDGKIYTLIHVKKINPKYNKTKPIQEDFIVILDQNGNEIKRVSILECLENSNYSPILKKMNKQGDILHTNTIILLNGKLAKKSPLFKKGNILISIRELNLICIIDLQKKRVVWALSNMWAGQHEPVILNNGNILIFDNKWRPRSSRIIEFNPFTHLILWSYVGTSAEPFYSAIGGSNQRLTNGNTLITETNTGRAFEVTRNKSIVWEFISPKRAAKNNELIASLFDMIRIDPDFPVDFLKKKLCTNKNNR